jgi:hypothetical protein
MVVAIRALDAMRGQLAGAAIRVAVVAIVMLAVACGGSGSGGSSTTDSITGFGALNATWVRGHQVMTSHFPAECTSGCQNRYYDPQASGDARLDVVQRERNRVIWLDVMPVPFETRQQIIADAMALLPPDAVQVDAGQQAECATVQFRSETIGNAFRKSGMEETVLLDLNLIDVVMFSGDVLPNGESPPYTPNKITEAQIHSGYQGSAKETPCS